MARYYDLVAGLPQLALRGGKSVPPYAGTLSALADAMTPEDARGLRQLRLVHDVANLGARILGLPQSFDARGNWSPEKLAAEIERPDEMPDFMVEFVRKNGAGGFGALEGDFVVWANERTTGWVRSWLLFDFHVRAAANALAARRSPRSARRAELPRVDEIAAAIERSSAPDFGLSLPLPWLPALVSAFEAGPLQAELAADEARWEMAGELTSTETFSEGAIYAFAVRLGLATRWAALDEETGRRRLERLVDALQVTVP